METRDFIIKLKKEKVKIALKADNLEVKFIKKEVSPNLINEIKARKQELIEYLKDRQEDVAIESIPKAPVQDSYPLSSAQMRLWVLSQKAEENAAYNMPTVIPIEEKYNINYLFKAIQAVIDRHEILRTVFRENKQGEIRQWVISTENLGFQPDFIDLSTSKKSSEVIEQFVQQDAFIPFDLSQGPLIRMTLFLMPDNNYTLYFNLHHIIGDGWSDQILMREVFEYYQLFENCETADIPPLRIQYKDYSVWELRRQESEEMARSKEFWLQELSGDLPVMDLPSTKVRPSQKTNNGRKIGTYISAEVKEKLKEYCHKNGGSLFIGFMTVLKALFYRYTGQSDLILGTASSGRIHSDLKNQIGFYANKIAFRSQVKSGDTFNSLFQRIKQTTLNAYTHQSYPFDQLIDDLKLKRDTRRSALIDVVIDYANFETTKETDYTRKQIDKIYDYGAVNSKFDLFFRFQESGKYIHFITEYNIDVYDADLIERFVKHFKSYLFLVLNSPDTFLKTISFISDDEVNEILNIFNDTTFPFPAQETIHNLFSKQSRETPDSVAVIDDKGTYTYQQIEENSNTLAHFIKSKIGITPGQRIGVLQSRKVKLVESFIAVLKAEGVYVPLDSNYPEERLMYMLNDSDVEVILVDKFHIELGNRLQWRNQKIKHLICVDSYSIYKEHGFLKDDLMRKDLWDYVGEESTDVVTGGGWKNSFTGKSFSEKEMDEYGKNVFLKLQPLLQPEMKVLEIGCASGITMFNVAPFVKSYHGTDLSSSILRKTKEYIKERGHDNINLTCIPAHEINQLDDKNFDIVIMNSVVQSFYGHNYLRDVLTKVIGLMKPKGYVFIGDIMDEAKRYVLQKDLLEFQKSNRNNKLYRTHTDLSFELFLSREYFDDMIKESIGLCAGVYTKKIHTIKNELTEYRFDALLTVDKEAENNYALKEMKWKHQYDLTDISEYPITYEGFGGTPSSLAYIIYTSGSTGKPKGVLIEHQGVINTSYDHIRQLKLTNLDHVLQFVATSFDGSVLDMFMTLFCGGKLVLANREIIDNPTLFTEYIERNNVTVITVPPAYLKMLNQAPLEGVRTIITAGEPAFVDDATYYAKRKIFFNAYGPTEATINSTLYKVDPLKKYRSIPIGSPAGNKKIFILDEALNILPIGVVGEICIGGQGVARGYQHNDKLTSERFINHPYHQEGRMYKTGDLGKWLSNGVIEFVGRKDEQVKLRGYRIELGEIENTLCLHNSVSTAVVVIKSNHTKEPRLVAYIKEQNGYELQINNLRSFLSRYLPEFMIPNHYVQLDEFPVTPNGKIDRKQLPNPKGLEMKTGVNFIAPSNELEETLLKIWKDLLGNLKISMLDNFFSLGGHSITAMKLVNKIKKTFGVELDMKSIFNSPILLDQAKLITRKNRMEYAAIPKAVKQENYVLSHAQKRLWILSQFGEGNVSYNMSESIPLEKNTDVDIFIKAIYATIERHEILRTVFRKNENDEIRQWVKPMEALNFKVEISDIQDKKMSLNKLLEKEALEPFDLMNGPLIRTRIYHTGSQQFVFFCNIHHIISDGWSMSVLAKDIFEFYTAFCNNRTPKLKELKIQYKDYAVWQRQLSYKVEESYWLKEFEGDLPVITFPLSKPRPKLKSYNGATMETFLGKESSQKIKEFSLENGGSLFIGLLATLKVMLFRYTGQEDLIIGSPIAGRKHFDIEDQVGFYINTLALRSKINAKQSFISFFEQEKQKVLDAYTYQNYPFDLLVDQLNLERDMSRSAIFDVMFVLQNISEKNGIDGVDEYKIVKTGTKRTKFDLLFNVEEVGNYIHICLEYNTDIYREEHIETFLSYYKVLLDKLVEHPRVEIGSLEYITEEERCRIEAFNNSTQTYTFDNVIQQFEYQSKKTPDKIALVFNGQQLTYSEVNGLSNQLAHYLRNRRKIKPNDRIGVMYNRSLISVVAMIGIIKSGACYVSIDHKYPTNRVQYIFSDAEIDCCISNEELFARHNLDKRQLIDWDSLDLDTPISNLEVRNIPSDESYVIYTSGSTGKPKGVLQTHRTLSNLINWHKNDSGIETGVKHLQYSSFSFDVSLQDCWAILSSGGTLHVASEEIRLEFRELLGYIVKQQIEVLSLPYSVISNLFLETELEQFKGHSIKHIISSGEQLLLNNKMKDFLKKYPSVKLHNHYGPSETHVVTYHTMDISTLQNPSPIGKVVTNTKIFILDNYFNPVPIGVKGEVFIAGDHLAKGYINSRKEMKERFIQHPKNSSLRLYKTGDIAYWDDSGIIHYMGRYDNQVKIRGYRIELDEITNTILSNNEVEGGIVLAIEGELVAYIITKNKQEIQGLRTWLKRKLPEYMLPMYFIYIDQIPLNSNGKVDKLQLPIPSKENVSKDTYVMPRTAVELVLTEIWEIILDKRKIGAKDNFFDIGGNSLKAMRLVSKIKKVGFNIEMPLLYQNPTIQALAKRILKGGSNQTRLVNLSIRQHNQKVFCIPGADGHVFGFQSLASSLKDQLSVYVFQSSGIDEYSEVLESIETIADRNISLLLEEHREPYTLLGYSFGACVAYQMCLQLTEMGYKVENLLFLDGLAPKLNQKVFSLKHVFTQALLEIGSLMAEKDIIEKDLVIYKSEKEQLKILNEKLCEQGISISNELLTRTVRVCEMNLLSAIRYTPKKLMKTKTKIYLYQCDQTMKDLSASLDREFINFYGWNELIKEEINIQKLNGNHYSVLKYPNIEGLENAVYHILFERSLSKSKK